MSNPCKLESSCLKRAAYDHDAQILQLTFRSGQIYDYHDLPFRLFTLLTQSSSPGQFFHTFIRNSYRHMRIQTKAIP
jgi:hypothetical protein